MQEKVEVMIIYTIIIINLERINSPVSAGWHFTLAHSLIGQQSQLILNFRTFF